MKHPLQLMGVDIINSKTRDNVGTTNSGGGCVPDAGNQTSDNDSEEEAGDLTNEQTSTEEGVLKVVVSFTGYVVDHCTLRCSRTDSFADALIERRGGGGVE